MKANTVSLLLRAEAGLELAGILAGYRWLHGSWSLFALLFLLPDLSMLGYLRGARTGAWAYNAAHTYSVPAVLAVVTWLIGGVIPSPLWLVWLGHIAFDRVLGYGLKQETGFGHTHLGWKGKDVTLPPEATLRSRHHAAFAGAARA